MRLTTTSLLSRLPIGLLFLALLLTGAGCGQDPGPMTVADDDGFRPAGWALTGHDGDDGDDDDNGNGSNEDQDQDEDYVSYTVDGGVGGAFALGDVRLVFPPSAVDGVGILTMERLHPRAAVWRFTVNGGHVQFQEPVRLEIDYADISEGHFHALMWLDERTGTWVRIPGTDDTVNDRFTAYLEHFSIYSLMIVEDGSAGWN